MSKYTDDLHAAFKLVNAYEVGRHYGCPVIHFNVGHAHAFGTKDHRAQVDFIKGSDWWQSKPIRLLGYGTLTESRKAHLDAAVKWAAKMGLGVEEWAPSGFSNSWIPKDAKDRITAELKEWRKLQRESKTTE